MDYFSGKVVLITGGARGIGLATAFHLGGRGAKIAITDVTDEILAEAKSALEAAKVEVLTIRSDVSRPEDCESTVKAVLDRFGKLDVLFNNAGVSVVDYFENCKPETAKKLYEVNLLGTVYMTMAGLDALKASRGHLILMSSVSGIRSMPTGSLYASSKAAVRSLGESLRLELKPHGVHVGVILPGFTTTDPKKTVMKGDGSARPINRPPHDTPEHVAIEVGKLIEGRGRERVLTAMGKATLVLQRLSPTFIDWYLSSHELQN